MLACQYNQPTNQSGLVTLTFDLKVVSESRVTMATSVPIFGLPRPLCSGITPDVRDRQKDRQTSDRRVVLCPFC